MQQGALT